MTKRNIDGIAIEIIDPGFGKGGQGVVQKALYRPSQTPLVSKILPQSTEAIARTRALIDLKLWRYSPYLAAPFAMDVERDDICHLAPMAEGSDMLNAPERSFLEHLEIAFQLSCLWTLLEDRGVAHGDIAPSNVIIDDGGAIHLIDFDNIVFADGRVPAQMRGQNMMLAPELRQSCGLPSLESDRFAFAVLFNILILRRHPVDGLTKAPADMDRVMSLGIWPERKRQSEPNEIPAAALGKKFCTLFDRAFLLDPANRPTADEWRRGFHQALTELVIHDCPNGFEGASVPNPNDTDCLYCGQPLGDIAQEIRGNLKILLRGSGQKFRVKLEPGKTIILGRQNIHGSPSMSRRQLSITPHRTKLLLRHLGSNPSTIILADGRAYRFETIWVDVPKNENKPIELDLAGTSIAFVS